MHPRWLRCSSLVYDEYAALVAPCQRGASFVALLAGRAVIMSIRCAAILFVLVAAAIHAEDGEWMSDDGRVVEMLLAHRDADRVDGGTLSIDRERRTLTWSGAANEIGCRRPWAASFDDVADVKDDEPGFLLVLRKGPQKEIRLAPLPHFAALLGQGRTTSVAPGVKEALKGPDKDAVPLSGSGASTTPTLARRALPPGLQRDSRRAAEAIARALGRSHP
jgi:hypothetical protein